MSEQDPQQYKPGDVVNGHVLTSDGQWVPVGRVPLPPPGLLPAPATRKSHKLRNIVLGVAAAVIVVGIIGSAFGSDDSGKTKTTAGVDVSTDAPASGSPSTAPTSTAPAASPSTAPRTTAPRTSAPSTTAPSTLAAPEPTKKPEPQATFSQEQALGSAKDYLAFGAFSKAGLIDQLSSKYGEGFPKADAEWAVEHLHVNWKEQAVESAKQYLKFTHFSRNGLIDQLSSSYGEQFTKAQATYAANQVGL